LEDDATDEDRPQNVAATVGDVPDTRSIEQADLLTGNLVSYAAQ